MCAINDPPPNPSAICMIGDRLMTDVAFGKLNGMLTIWTRKPIDETADNRMAVMVRSKCSVNAYQIDARRSRR